MFISTQKVALALLAYHAHKFLSLGVELRFWFKLGRRFRLCLGSATPPFHCFPACSTTCASDGAAWSTGEIGRVIILVDVLCAVKWIVWNGTSGSVETSNLHVHKHIHPHTHTASRLDCWAHQNVPIHVANLLQRTPCHNNTQIYNQIPSDDIISSVWVQNPWWWLDIESY